MHTHAVFRDRLRAKLRDPIAWTEGIQVVKTVVAAVVAWIIAKQVFDLPQPFLAPWAALLVVHATVYRSFWKGAKQITATVIGVILSWAVGNTLGLDPAAIAVMLLAALLIGQVRWLKEEGTTAAATALIVLTTGFSDQDQVLIGRLWDTAIGVGVGVVVNAVVWPPLRDLTAARAIEAVGRRVGDLLADIAEECRDECSEEHVDAWIRRSQDLDVEVDDAWALVRQARESGRLNPRKDSAVVRKPGEFGEILDRTEQALAEIRSLGRTMGHSITDSNQWDDQFRERWTGLLKEVAWAIQNPDARRLGEVRTKLTALASDYSDENLSSLHWPEYGGLILNLRNIATSMDRVAASDPVSESTRGPLGASAL
ncbi:MAG TPA: FUSC family protein [Nocardioidaceae bacterium]|nr:FUSC family protein [Nocardioidaceae bacterium]